MKSSSKNKSKVDDISVETQRLVKDSHVPLPYHVPKQKSLKDFLNRQKIATENQVSLTGSKKLLQKAWELIEIKEQNVEKFYNEISIQDETCEEPKSSSNNDIHSLQTYTSNSHVDLDDINCNNGIIVPEYDDEENCENSSINSELSDRDEISSLNDDENSNDATSLCSEKSSIQSQNDQKLKNHFSLNKSANMASQFIDDEAELSELDGGSDDEDNLSLCIYSSENEEIEISKKKKRRPILLSESSEDENNSDTDIEMASKDLIPINDELKNNILTNQLDDEHFSDIEKKIVSNDLIPLFNEPEKNVLTEQLMDEEHNLNTEIKIASNDLSPLFNESEKEISTQQLMELCSGQFQTQPESQENVLEDSFDSSVPLGSDDEDDKNNDESNENNDESNENDMPKLTSINDFFDDEAELSESDWSSDDENNDTDKLDKLDEEAGDKDVLDEKLIKDGLDKIYMRQLLDDDIKQVTELKERLLEDGELYSDNGRKRKFQWDETEQNDDSFKKPLFSDSEDEDEDDELNFNNDLSGLWRKERYKRESYLSQQNNSDDEILLDCEESGDTLQTSTVAVKKTHFIKYTNNEILQSNDKSIVVDINKSTISDSREETKINTKSLILPPCTTNISKEIRNNVQSYKLLKGSFIKRKNVKKITTLLNMNTNNDQTDGGNDRPFSTITTNGGNNPFAYMLMNNKKQDNKNVISKDIKPMNAEKKENVFNSQPSTSVQLTEETENKNKITNSILMHLE